MHFLSEQNIVRKIVTDFLIICFLEYECPEWYPGGPTFEFFPHLVTDQSRPWGESCPKCPNNVCSGHYVTDLDSLNVEG